MVIEPGDLVIGDDDGFLCVPFDAVTEVYAKAHAKHATEAESVRKIAAGTNDRTWIDKKLKELGCEIE